MSKSKKKPCIICNNRSFVKLWSGCAIRPPNRRRYDLLVCRNCGLGIIHPFPSTDEIRHAYPRSYYHNWVTYGNQTFVRWESWLFRLRRMIFTFPPVSRPDGPWNPIFPKNARILDAGCATGMYLYFLMLHGYQHVYGVEMSAIASDFGRRMGLDIQTGAISECQLEPNSFDVIRLHHVLEHLPDLKGDLCKLAAALRSGGLLMVRVPNIRSLAAKVFRSSWAGWDPPRHIWYFTPRSGRILLDDVGFSDIKVICNCGAYSLLKALNVMLLGKVVDRGKPVVDYSDNPLLIAGIKSLAFIPDLLWMGGEIVFTARKD